MSITIAKSAYEKLIKEDLDFLNKHCPDIPESKAYNTTVVTPKGVMYFINKFLSKK